MAIVENVEAFAVRQALSWLDRDPEKNLPKLLDWFDRFDRKDTLKVQRDIIRNVVMDPDNNWHHLVMSLWKDIDPGVRNRIFENLIINGCLLGYQRQVENKEKYNCNIPWAILLDPGAWHLCISVHRRRASCEKEGHHPAVRGSSGLRVLHFHQRNADRRGLCR